MSFYTHRIKSDVELNDWIHDYAVSFTTTSNLGLATALNDLVIRNNMPFELTEVVYTTVAFINDDDWNIFEFTTTMLGHTYERINTPL